MRPILYVVVNKSLEMSPGKVAAQVGHAVAGVMATTAHRLGPARDTGRGDAGVMATTPHPEWMKSPHRWLIVLEADDGLHLWNLHNYLRDRDVKSYMVIDEGVNEIPPMSATALGVEVLDKDSTEATYLEGFPLFSYKEQLVQAFKQGQESHKWRYRYPNTAPISPGDWLQGIFPWF